MNIHPLLAGLQINPDFLLQNLDFRERRGLVVKISESAYRQTAFLDERVLRADTQGAWFPLADLLQAATGTQIARPPHYIFHVGHCGSTLVSRLLGELPSVFSLREPIILLALAIMQRALDTPESPLDDAEWQRLLKMSLALLSRTYHKGDRPVIKLTSAAGNLLGSLLAESTDSKALLMYVDLETYLATMLRAEATRENLRAYADTWLADFRRRTGGDNIGAQPMDEARQAVISWLAMLLAFSEATAHNPGRTLWMHFDTFLNAPASHLQQASQFFGLQAAPEAINQLASGPWMKRYAKDPQQQFDRQTRHQELAQARKHLQAEIHAALDWTESLCMDIPLLETALPYLRPNLDR
ncbi:MAG: hypothetical protein KGL13_00865 [Gammaproteobacteria bacterium]|nr:hypothetical protein [Gammaproteobacteria bacterium]MDE2344993.1 hypothetical protein [Gammaproteobacteria bacterium]